MHSRRALQAILLSFLASLFTLPGCGYSEEDAVYRSPIAEATGNPYLAYSRDGHMVRVGEDPEFTEHVELCMKMLGFTYVEPPQTVDVEVAFRGGLEVGTEEYVNRYGFGVSTQVFHQEALPDDLVGYPGGVLQDLELQAQGVNADPFAGVPRAEIDAYMEALHGERGCYEQTASEWFDEAVEFRLTYADELRDLEEAARNDKRILDRDAALRRCVAGHGYSEFEDLESTIRTLRVEVATIEAADPDLDEIPIDAPISTMQASALRELQTLELGLAAAVLDCDPALIAVDELFLSVLSEYEEQFVCEQFGC